MIAQVMRHQSTMSQQRQPIQPQQQQQPEQQQQQQRKCKQRYQAAVNIEAIPPVSLKHVDGLFMHHGIMSPSISKGEPSAASSYLVIPIVPIEGEEVKEKEGGQGGAEAAAAASCSVFDEEPIKEVSVNSSSCRTTPYSDHLDRLCFTSLVAIAHCKNNDNNNNNNNSSSNNDNNNSNSSEPAKKLSYLSCRTEFKVTGSAFCEYRSEIGEYEVFELDYSFEDGTYAFKSRHNQLVLHYNPYLRTVVFNSPTPSARWHLIQQQQQQNPKVTSSTTPSSLLLPQPQVIYLGLANLHGDPDPIVLAENKKASGFDQSSFQKVLALLKENVSKPRSCTIFNLPDVQQQWIVKTDENSTTAIVVTTVDYPTVVAIECNDDVAALYHHCYKQYSKQNKNETTTAAKKPTSSSNSIPPKHKQQLIKELFATRIYYNDLEDATAATTIYYDKNEDISKLDEMTSKVRDRMQENIQDMIANIESAEQLKQKSEMLLSDALVFKKRAKKLKRNPNTAFYMGIMGGVGAVVGGLSGYIVGGPIGSAYLTSQGAKLGVTFGAGFLGGNLLYRGATAASDFWTNTFVPIHPPQNTKK